MIGMSIFDLARRARTLTASLGLVVSVTAADVTLLGDDKLTGDIIAMDSVGTITLVSPVSGKPLLINGDRVKSVDFGISEESEDIPDQRVELVNGDILPVRVSGLENSILQAGSADLGQFGIPRELVDSVQLGIVPNRPVFIGLNSADGWTRDDGGTRNWKIQGGRYLATGQGMISRDVDLPEKFILRFELDWEAHPNFRLFFGGSSKSPREKENRYFLQFAASGFEIKRETTGNNRYTPIVMLGRAPDQFPGNSLLVEIRMDRSTGDIQLYINEELEGRYTDPVAEIPAGGHIALVSQAPQESEQTVSGFEIFEWDERGDRHRSEDRGDRKLDSLIGRYGERFGGILTGIREDKQEEGAVYLFKSDFQEDVIEMPEQEVSTIFFASEDGEKVHEELEGLILRLRGGGEMRISTCEFREKSVKVVHPLLGEMELDRAGITSLERRTIPKAEPVENR